MTFYYFSAKGAEPLQPLQAAAFKMQVSLKHITALPQAFSGGDSCLIFDFPQLGSQRPEALCRKVRALAGGQRLHLLGLLSQRRQEDLLPKLLEAGLNDFVSLPTSPLVLESRLRLARLAATSPAELLELIKKLEQLHRAKDEFTAMVSTELRGPLMTSLGYIELLLSGGFGPISEKLSARMKIAVKNLRRISRLIEDMLKYNSLIDEAFVDAPKLEVWDIVELAEEVHQQFLARRGIVTSRVNFSAPEHPLRVLIDRTMIKTVLENLLDNADKHAGPEALIRVTIEPPTNGEAEITVADTGRGIPCEIRERAFQPFVKGTDSTEGYGLGLAVARAVLRAHRAKLFLKSDEGKGTSISFWLPVAAVASQLP